MTRDKRSRFFCEQCRYKNDCGYYIHNRQDECIDNEAFMYGWEYGKNDTLEEIEKFVDSMDWEAFPITNFERLRNKIKELKGE